jgi:L-amino acid N-acyltransferase YncA
MIFRDATINDLPEIVSIYNSTIAGRMVTADTEPVTISDKENWFYEHNSNTRPLWMLHTEENECIGWVSFQDFYGRVAYSGTAEISIYLKENMRGKGYGKKILLYSIDKAPMLNIHTLLGYIFAHNEPSLQLFYKAGFEDWAHLKDIAIMDGNNYSLKILGRKI